MSIPDLPFLADDIVWAEVPIICWLIAGTISMLVVTARFGSSRAHEVLVRYRLFWGVSLVLAVILSVFLQVTSGQPLPMYL